MNYAEKRKEFSETNMRQHYLFASRIRRQARRPVIKPNLTEEFDYEGELAVIIGKAGENINRSDALSHGGL
jgi:2-keto-4-pentenoate hydratase/2-oxohepta-3-ene-1,7-dioic acid hydratase in catechol pathway